MIAKMRSILLALLLLSPAVALAQSCPQPLAGAHRLVLVVADTLSSSTGTLQRFTRAAPDSPWHADGGPVSALIGRKGVAWAHAFRQFAKSGEPVKVDGDKRAPAGFYRIGRSFGFVPSSRANYMRVGDGTVCVDDPSSPAYNAITSRAKVGWKVHGENMWRVPEYRQGLLVDYPTNARARAGSCIFIHVRKPGAAGTAGCVAVPEPDVTALQDFSAGGAVLAVLPRQALDRFRGCLPN